MQEQQTELTAMGTPVPARWKPTVIAIWAGQVVSFLTSGAASYAIIWYLTETTESPMILALGTITYFLPVALLGPVAGVFVDRHNRKHVMIAADIGIAVLSVLAALTILAGWVGLPLVFAIIAARSIGQTFHMPAMQAAMPLLVPERHLVRMGSLTQGTIGLTNIAAPALGILFYTLMGLSVPLLLDACGAAVACTVLAFVTIPDVHLGSDERTGVISEMRDGIAEIRSVHGMGTFFILVTLGCIAFMPMSAMFPLMTYDHFGGDGYAASLIEAVWSGGFVAGSVVLGVWGGGKRLLPLVIVSLAASGAVTLACGLLPPDGFVWFIGLCVLMAVTGAFFNNPLLAIIQKNIAAEKLGRVMAVFGSLTSLASPLGLAVAGPVAELTGVPFMFLVSGIGLMLVAGLSLCFPYLHRLDSAPANAANAEANAATGAGQG